MKLAGHQTHLTLPFLVATGGQSDAQIRKESEWGFVNIRVVLEQTYRQGWLKVQALPSFSSRWLTMTGLFAKASSLLLRREDWVPAMQVNCTVSRSLLQQHGYRNTGGMGKLEGAEGHTSVLLASPILSHNSLFHISPNSGPFSFHPIAFFVIPTNPVPPFLWRHRPYTPHETQSSS